MPKTPHTPAFRADGWMNSLTSLGVIGKDKRRASRMHTDRVPEFEAEELWRGDMILARAVETIPQVMMRNGFEVKISDEAPEKDPKSPPEADEPGDFGMPKLDRASRRRRARLDGSDDQADIRKGLTKKLEQLAFVESYIEAMNYARAFGGGAILPFIDEQGKRWNDLERFALPLDTRRLKDIRSLKALRPHECMPIRWYNDPLSPKYGTPKLFRVVRDVMGGTAAHTPFLVHETRLIRFYGVNTSVRQRAMNNSWGESIFGRLIEAVADFHGSHQAIGTLISDFAQAVMKIKGLSALVSRGKEGERTVARRAELAALSRSVARMLILDEGEEFERKPTPVTGLADLVDRLAHYIAALAETPVTLLMGQAPAGLNATGDSDIRWFYDKCANDRVLHLEPKLRPLLEWLFLCTEGPTAGVEPTSWKVKWHALWQPTPLEESTIRKNNADADAAYVTAGVLTPEEVASSRFGGAEYGNEIELDQDMRDTVQEAHAGFVQEQLANGQVPSPSATASTSQQNAVELAKAQPDPLPGDEKPAPGKKGVKADVHDWSRYDGDDDQPRDEKGMWTNGSGSAVDTKAMSLKELHGHYMSVMHEAGSVATQSPKFKAVVKELKSRGIKSLTTLERKMGK